MDLRIHACTVKDLDALATLSRTTFSEAFREQNNPEDFSQYMEAAFSREKLRAELTHPDSFFYFVYAGPELAGYFKVNRNQAQTDLREADGLELERIYVCRAQQGKQIGSYLLNRVIEIARELGKSYVWLGVWQANTAAIRFYERYGFTKFGSHPYYIGNDRQTDWLMRLELTTLKTHQKSQE